jgi:hypothetical protein
MSHSTEYPMRHTQTTVTIGSGPSAADPIRGYSLSDRFVYLQIGPVTFSAMVKDADDAMAMLQFAENVDKATAQFVEGVKGITAKFPPEPEPGLSPDGAGADVEAYRG